MPFTFGIITDTHIRPEGGDQSSPYPVNDLANGRAGYAARLLAAQSPAFSIHLGDVVHPLPHLPTYGAACEAAKGLLAPLGPDLRYVPGNHDIGDKPHDVSPAGPVTVQTMAAYDDAFGPSWQSFEAQGVRFITLNSSLVNLGSEAEASQRVWLEAELAAHRDQRTFLFSHYPPFIDSADEPEHYDNYAEPGRHWLLDLCADHGVEAIFSGHVHHFFYNRYKGVKLYCLPATSFTRQDYAELFPVAPAPEFGRDDRGKFAVTLVDVEEDGHRLRIVPTDGAVDGITARRAVPARIPLTPHLRHAWARSVDLPYNGPMEEFSRKRARNDYPLLRLWQMGIETVRTPLADLVDPEGRQRMLDWAASGMRFLLFTTRIPISTEVALMKEHEAFITGLEIAVPGDTEGPDATPALPFPVRLGLVQTSASRGEGGSKFTHNVSFGYRLDQTSLALHHIGRAEGLGVTFKIDAEDDLAAARQSIGAFRDKTDGPLGIVVRLAASNPAVQESRQDWIAARLRAALDPATAWPDIDVQIDTLVTVDRGYAPRDGLIDRLGNLTPAGLSLIERA